MQTLQKKLIGPGIKELSRGAYLMPNTTVGNILLGTPPEVIKETLDFSKGFPPAGIPDVVIVPEKFINDNNLALQIEPEFPTYASFFLAKKKLTFVCTELQKPALQRYLELSLFGKPQNLSSLYPEDKQYLVPDMQKETAYFSGFKLEDVAEFVTYTPGSTIEISKGTGKVSIDCHGNNTFTVIDNKIESKVTLTPYTEIPGSAKSNIEITDEMYFGKRVIPYVDLARHLVNLKKEDCDVINGLFDRAEADNFVFKAGVTPLDFDIVNNVEIRALLQSSYNTIEKKEKVEFLSANSGFNLLNSVNASHRYANTVSFMIYDHFGDITLVDPPMNTVQYLVDHNIPLNRVKSIVITHNHGDHDAGFAELALKIGHRVTLYTTPSIKNVLAEKIALSQYHLGLTPEMVSHYFDFQPVDMKKAVKIGNYYYDFFHALHSIETVGFSWSDEAGNCIGYYSADTQLDETVHKDMDDKFIATPERLLQVRTLPKKALIYILENGIPPLHTSGETLSKLDKEILDRAYLVHTDKYPMVNGKVWDEATLAGMGTLVDISIANYTENNQRQRVVVDYLEDLASLPFFSGNEFSIAEITMLAKEFVPVRYRDGEIIFHEGDHADALYFVQRGGYEAYKGISFESKQAVLNARMAGKSIGIRTDRGTTLGEAVAFKSEARQKRSATAVAIGETAMLKISQAGVRRIMDSNTILGKMLRRMFEFKAQGLDKAFLDIGIFKDMHAAEISSFIAAYAKKTTAHAQDIIIKEGATLNNVYIIIGDSKTGSGVSLYQYPLSSNGFSKATEKVLLNEGKPLAIGCYGERSVFTDEGASCDVVATGDVTIYQISKKDLQTLSKKYPSIQYRILEKINHDWLTNAQRQEEVASLQEALSSLYSGINVSDLLPGLSDNTRNPE